MFELTRRGMAFLDEATHTFDNQADIGAPPAVVFQWLSDPSRMGEWFKDFAGAEWLSSPPHNAGSVREVRLKGIRVRERFLLWQPDERLAFAIDSINLPLVRNMIEDMRLEPIPGGTRVRWVVYYQPTWFLRVIHPIARWIFGRMFRKSLAQLAERLQSSPGQPVHSPGTPVDAAGSARNPG
ncbi:MAG: hypothetical protein GMKNLPBB_03053 [Myxococcota bacterium]|nr:hypothetical protein [Myxococcota bacterium]